MSILVIYETDSGEKKIAEFPDGDQVRAEQYAKDIIMTGSKSARIFDAKLMRTMAVVHRRDIACVVKAEWPAIGQIK